MSTSTRNALAEQGEHPMCYFYYPAPRLVIYRVYRPVYFYTWQCF
jgi:hypothetical protein